MARKNLLKGLMEEAAAAPPAPSQEEQRVDAARPRYSGGAIGAVSQSIADLKSRSVVEIDPHHITAGGLSDRLDDEDEDHAALVESLREHGQQVPVLVRPDPETPDRYQIVYGRRRVKALRELGLPVKALVRSLDEREMLLAQGQENTARKDLSFIEKASFARQMRDLGYERPVICAALHVDKTVISRMLSVVDRLAPDLIAAIGAAPSVGRDRWLALADQMAKSDTDTDAAIALVNLAEDGSTSDKRFEALFKALTLPRRAAKRDAPAKTPLRDAEGRRLGHVSRANDATILTLPQRMADGFDEWLVENISEIHRSWKDSRGE
ncbi:MAG: plasmid partitioning protein RepB [Paracoccaceae bacterium]